MKILRKAFILLALSSLLSLANMDAFGSSLTAREDWGEERGGQEHQFNHSDYNHNDYNHNNYNHAQGAYDYGRGYQHGNQSGYHGNINIEGNPYQNSNSQYVLPYQQPDQEANWNYFQEQPPQ